MNNALEQFINKNSDRAEEYKLIIEDMMGDYSSYHYAESTLLGILDFIEQNDNITDAQVKAVENIRDNPGKRHGY